MNVRELTRTISGLATNGRGALADVVVECKGERLPIRDVEFRAIPDPNRRPKDVVVIIVADHGQAA